MMNRFIEYLARLIYDFADWIEPVDKTEYEFHCSAHPQYTIKHCPWKHDTWSH